MTENTRVAIVDHGLGNLFSVQRACAFVGMEACITSSKQSVLNADAVILPGVGAFGDAMATLRQLDLVSVLKDCAAAGKPFMGICLGVQLLMTESYEFGRHKGLDLVEGDVVRFQDPREGGRILKVPHTGWNTLEAPATTDWRGTLLDGINHGSYMYFVHSYLVRPADEAVVLSQTTHGDVTFCSTLRKGSIFACQYHPERSGPSGLRIYQNLKDAAQRRM
jgi:imidazole glycerol-phosphate synthase subunit HisH